MAWYWWLLVGILMGWLLSTLIEWLWFRRKRMEVQDERIAELESALRASEDDGPASSRGSSAAPTGAAATIPATLADREVTLEAPDLDAPVTMPDVDLPDVSAEMSGFTASIGTAVDMPDVDLPDISADRSGFTASLGTDVDMPDINMPDVDMPDAGLPDMSAQISGLNASINTAVDMPNVDMPNVDMPRMDMPDVDMPDVDLPDMSAGTSGFTASLATAADMPDIDMPDMDMPDMDMPDVDLPDMDLPDVSAGLDVAKTGLGAAALAAGAAVSAGAAGMADDLTGGDVPGLGGAVAANTNYPDDLTEILGIGRVYETRLYRAGIFTWDQVANMAVSGLEEATEAIDAANAEDWPAQAQSLAQANNRIGARYHGPLPDKLSAIKGIGEGAEQRLYRAGILTFAQLAATTVDDLAAVLPAYRGDFSDWIVQASAKL